MRAEDGERVVTLHRLDERSHEDKADKPRARATGSTRRPRERISIKTAGSPETPLPATPVNPAPTSSDRRSPYERF
jgi:hypothetical protein